MERLSQETHHASENMTRSLAKTLSYRIVILILDFVSIYLFTHQVRIAIGFMIVSNIYTSLAYFFHERIWDRIKWGKNIFRHDGA